MGFYHVGKQGLRWHSITNCTLHRVCEAPFHSPAKYLSRVVYDVNGITQLVCENLCVLIHSEPWLRTISKKDSYVTPHML